MASSTQPSENTFTTPVPNRHQFNDEYEPINPAYVEHIEKLLKVAHDKMDDDNVATGNGQHCRWCKGPWGVNEMGIRHEEDCIIVQIRRVINV